MKLGSTLHLQGTVFPRPRHEIASLHRRPHVARLAVRAALEPFGDVSLSLEAGISAGQLALPAFGGAILTVIAAKFAAYSQLEVVRTAMLSRHVKSGGAKVLQLGGSTRDIFYYPKGTIQVTAAAPDLKIGLWEQAGMQSGVPVRELKVDAASALSSTAGAAYDSVVAFDQLASIPNLKAFMGEVWRVLKPGGTFVFIQRVQGSPVAALVQLGGTSPAGSSIGDEVAASQSWDFVQWDLASGALDPHAVGVAIKPLQGKGNSLPEDEFSVDTAAFEQVMKAKQSGKAAGKKKGAREKKGFGGN